MAVANQTEKSSPGANTQYIVVVSVLTFVLPAVCTIGQIFISNDATSLFALFGKWFIFSAVGLRLFLAGIVRELGFANLCFGLIGIVFLFMTQWRVVSAFGSGLYYGIAGLQHVLKKPAGINEMFALVTDILIFILLLVYFVTMV